MHAFSTSPLSILDVTKTRRLYAHIIFVIILKTKGAFDHTGGFSDAILTVDSIPRIKPGITTAVPIIQNNEAS